MIKPHIVMSHGFRLLRYIGTATVTHVAVHNLDMSLLMYFCLGTRSCWK